MPHGFGATTTRTPLVRELNVPPEVLRELAARFPERYPLLLDSAARGPLSDASLLLAQPSAALWLSADGALRGDGMEPQGTSFLAALEQWWLKERLPAHEGGAELAFAGGWAIFLGYELAQEVEPHLALPRTPLPWIAFALRTRAALVHELRGDRVLAVAEPGAEGALDQIERDAASVADLPATPDRLEIRRVEEEDPAAYLARVVRAKEYVRAGDIYQANLARAWDVTLGANADHASAAGTSTHGCVPANPAPFAALRAVAGRGDRQFLARAPGARQRPAHRHAPDCRHAPAQPPPRG